MRVMKYKFLGDGARYYYYKEIGRKVGSNLLSHNLHTHIPVMCDEVIHFLNPQKNNLIIDMTFGAGGHTKTLLKLVPDIRVICLDRDPACFQLAEDLSKSFPKQVFPLLGKFSELPLLLTQFKPSVNFVDGIIFDFGCSSMQFDDSERGFSLSKDGPLDMRMDNDRCVDSITARDVIEYLSEEELSKVFKLYGEEKLSKKISRAITEYKYKCIPIESTSQLADLVSVTCSNELRRDKLNRSAHVATKIFQALRIFVNNELNEIDYGISLAYRFLKVGGRLVSISFHSLEDTIVKRHITGNILKNSISPPPLKYSAHNTYFDSSTLETFTSQKWLSINKHVVTPSHEEIERNPRSRSAKLRSAIRL